ncbi:hypothetical protein GC175_03575 [bacterium]|nr:hypothetical protein [bacterium]
MTLADIQRTAELLRPVYEQMQYLDGYVSLEVNPQLAHNTAGTIAEARRLFAALDRPNVMIKVPATPADVAAIEELIAEGINVNVTLIFGHAHYEAVAEVYMRGLERRVDRGLPVNKIASVASFFISRVDTMVDAALESVGNRNLQGTIGIANAKSAYVYFRSLFSGARWRQLADRGARVQRPLWASTGTKNPAYPDTLYVGHLISGGGAGVVYAWWSNR